ncbi:TetR/AcrR family transcriptional regulator [Frankia sp. Mgl5]|uniref:TetR/AcrR family transcriptional regulator n=1 Tax=Frankia sp. Mgl5 TaxID=2933793 RepID=UPI00200DC063|nr:TetR/AcrR family transcriptional regulator [Frankia sp. Mgl5]
MNSAQQLMLEHGYAAVTYRGLAARAGVAASLVQYYFPTLDDLFVALLRSGTDRILERFAEASQTEQPLRAVWEYASDKTATALLLEFMALANHRKAIQSEIGRGGERVRDAQLEAVSRQWTQYGLDERAVSPAGLLFMMNAILRMLALEETFGTHTGHRDAVEIIERFLDHIEPRRHEREE